MKKQLLALPLLIISLLSFGQEATTFILVRHGEKKLDGSENPSLSEIGLQRANNLAELLALQEVDALYSTPLNRTEETLTPIARDKGIEVQSYDPSADPQWLAKLIKKYPGGTVVISGHSNTIPSMANALLGSKVFNEFDESDYSNLIIIVASQVGKGKLLRLRY